MKTLISAGLIVSVLATCLVVCLAVGSAGLAGASGLAGLQGAPGAPSAAAFGDPGESADTGRPADSGPMLAHMVYFELKENTEAARDKLVAACKEYLAGHDGTFSFSVGVLAEDYQREVNDRDFHVALHVIFRTKAAHDAYQKHPRHLKFIEESKENWKKVRVFDSYLRVGPMYFRQEGAGAPTERAAPDGPAVEGTHADKVADKIGPTRIPLPDPASFFAGMVQAKVVSKEEGHVVVLVEKILEEWKHSKAQNSKSLLGKQVMVRAGGTEGRGKAEKGVERFLRILKVGEVVPLDVAHKDGDFLDLLELTQEERERVRG